MSKGTAQRLAYFKNFQGWKKQINIAHLRKTFMLSRQSVSCIIDKYRDKFPNHLVYNSSNIAFIATNSFTYSFSHQNSLNQFSVYLDEIALGERDYAHSIDVCIFELEAPFKNSKTEHKKPILRVIRANKTIYIGNIIRKISNYLDRIIPQCLLTFDGLHWYVMTCCNKTVAFKYFILSRFNGKAVFEE